MCRSSSKIESNKEQDFGLDDSLLIERSLKGDLIIRGYIIYLNFEFVTARKYYTPEYYHINLLVPLF